MTPHLLDPAFLLVKTVTPLDCVTVHYDCYTLSSYPESELVTEARYLIMQSTAPSSAALRLHYLLRDLSGECSLLDSIYCMMLEPQLGLQFTCIFSVFQLHVLCVGSFVL